MRGELLLRDGRKLPWGDRTSVMGILNVTPDSFYPASRRGSVEEAVETAIRMRQAGARIIDIGGESTRPGSDPVDADEEAERVVPVVSAIRETCPDLLLSVDTYRAATARAAVEAGADIVNDVSGLCADADMAETVAKLGVPVVIMHAKGTPKTMQKAPYYKDVVAEVEEFFRRQIDAALSAGIHRDRIILDLGIGFGKTAEHNLTLLRNLDRFVAMDYPHLVAVSRKRTISAVLGVDSPEERLNGTLALTAYAAMKGASMVRVHDVKENAEVVRMLEAVRGIPRSPERR